jgi:hypothetical protein
MTVGRRDHRCSDLFSEHRNAEPKVAVCPLVPPRGDHDRRAGRQ